MNEIRRCSLCGAQRNDGGACSLLGCRDPLFDQREEEKFAAAEERGRRRGVEEAAKVADRNADTYGAGIGMIANRGTAKEIRALAPRSSAPPKIDGAACAAVHGYPGCVCACSCHGKPRSSAPDSVTPSALPRDEGKEG